MPIDREDRTTPAPKTPKLGGSTSAGASVPAPPPAPVPADGVFTQSHINDNSSWMQLLNQQRAAGYGQAEGEPVWKQLGFASEDEQRDAVNPFKNLPPGAVMGPGYTAAVTQEQYARSGQNVGLTRDDIAKEQADAAKAVKTRGMRKGGTRGDTYQMTWEDYQALSDQQRAAVDFNTALARAVRNDLRHQDDYASVEATPRLAYDTDVERMFGEDGGSTRYAPQTVALLKQIGFTDDGADLDQFLNLRAAITDKDLKRLQWENVPGLSDQASSQLPAAANERMSYVDSISDAAAQRLDELMSTPGALPSPKQNLLSQSQVMATGYGADTLKLNTPPGFGPAGEVLGDNGITNKDFSDALFVLASKQITPEKQQEFLGVLNSQLTPEQRRAFMSYADARTRQAAEYDLPLGSDPSVQYRGPEEIRKLLGLDS